MSIFTQAHCGGIIIKLKTQKLILIKKEKL